jgi:hypothetical protein
MSANEALLHKPPVPEPLPIEIGLIRVSTNGVWRFTSMSQRTDWSAVASLA